MIVQWSEHISDATSFCREAFDHVLGEHNLRGANAEDMFSRMCNRYVIRAQTIYDRHPEYFKSIERLNQIVDVFVKKDQKWFKGIMRSRIGPEFDHVPSEVLEDLLSWVARRYNFWLANQIS